MKQKEFSYGQGMRIFGTLCCILLLLVFIIGPIYLYINEPEKEGFFYASLVGAAFFIPLCILGILDVFKTRLIITKSEVKYVSVLRKRTIKKKHISSFSRDQNYFAIHSKKSNQKPIKLSTYFSGINEIERWLLLEIDVKDKAVLEEEEQYDQLEKEYRHLSSDGKSGEEKLAEAKKVAKYINIALIALAANVLVPFTPSDISMILAIVGGLLAILFVFRFNGLIKYTLYSSKDKVVSIFPSIGFGMFALSFIVSIKIMLPVSVLDGSALWMPLVVLVLLLTGLCTMGSQLKITNKAKDIVTLFNILLFTSAFSYGSIMFFNEYLDSSKADQYDILISGKDMSGGKSKSWYLETTQVPLEGLPTNYSVGEWLYNQKRVGDTFYVFVRQGKFGISYYRVKASPQ